MLRKFADGEKVCFFDRAVLLNAIVFGKDQGKYVLEVNGRFYLRKASELYRGHFDHSLNQFVKKNGDILPVLRAGEFSGEVDFSIFEVEIE